MLLVVAPAVVAGFVPEVGGHGRRAVEGGLPVDVLALGGRYVLWGRGLCGVGAVLGDWRGSGALGVRRLGLASTGDGRWAVGVLLLGWRRAP